MRNSAPVAPTTPEAQLQWLVDRAVIADLQAAFGRAMDSGDWDAYGTLLHEDMEFAVNGRVLSSGRQNSVDTARSAMSRYKGIWHHPGNPGIEIDGDRAQTRSYSMGVHMLDERDLNKHSTGAGWYDCELVRTTDGWKFRSVNFTVVWTAGENARPA